MKRAAVVLGAVALAALLVRGGSTSSTSSRSPDAPIPPSGPGQAKPRLATPINATLARELIGNAFIRITGGGASPETVDLLMAQSAFETGNWQSMGSWNFGNVTRGNTRWNYWERDVPEYIDGKVKIVRQKFRAYRSPDTGAADWIHVLRTQYPSAWQIAVGSADPVSFVYGLKADGYFTGDREAYSRGVERLTAQFRAQREAIA